MTWQQLSLSHDDNGNLTADGLFKYKYDAWNRLVGVWYNAGDMSVAGQRVATYAYDGLFRRTEKLVANQGVGVVYKSDAGGITGIQAGNRHEHYFWGGMGVSPVNWRLVETTDHASGDPYSYANSHVLDQTVYGTKYIDEPVCRDRNTNVYGTGADNNCLDSGGSQRYFYHQDANYRVVMLTGEDGAVVERYEYTAYGEPTVYGGYSSSAGDELGHALLVSTVGNPLMHQGLFRDGEIHKYQNRRREYDSLSGRFMQRDPWRYRDSLNLYHYLRSRPIGRVDPSGKGFLSWINGFGWSGEVADAFDDAFATSVSDRTAGTIDAVGRIVTVGIVDNAGDALGNGTFDEENREDADTAATVIIVAATAAISEAAALEELAAGASADEDNEESPPNPEDAKQTGSYTNTHESGTKYHGKGSEERARESGKRTEKEYGDPLKDTDWTPAENDREAFKDEHRRIKEDGGPGLPRNYNKINSPGKRYCGQDRRRGG